MAAYNEEAVRLAKQSSARQINDLDLNATILRDWVRARGAATTSLSCMTDRPDLLLICCDQLSGDAVGCGDTPNLDALAAQGTAFERCYAACPLCLPSRASFWSGQLPHRTGVLSNGRWLPTPAWADGRPTLGTVLSAAGWDCVHFGKDHSAGTLSGFTVVPEVPGEATAEHPAWPVSDDTRRDAATVPAACAHLRRAGGGPRCTVVDLQNPHDICSWIGDRAGGNRALPPGELPPLPANHASVAQPGQPLSVQYVCCAHNRQAQASTFDQTDWRCYVAAYRHYVRRADRAIGEVLAALDASVRRDRTLVVCFADHGDNHASHALATKHCTFYEETVRVPLIVAGPGVATGVRVSELASLLDLLPTLGGLLGVASPAGDGVDLSGWLRGAAGAVRPQVVSEWYSEWGSTIEPGRMLCRGRWKYVHYREGDGEQLFDLDADPGELVNRAAEPSCAAVLAEHRRRLDAHLTATADPYRTLAPLAETRWRAHPPGAHVGPAAPMVRQAGA